MDDKALTITTTKLTQRIEKATRDRMIPGIGIVFGNATKKTELYFGKTTYDDDGIGVAQDTIYDVASLTKLFTAAVVMKVISGGHLALEDSVGTILGSEALRDIHIIHLLSHTSGINLQCAIHKDEPDILRKLALITPPSVTPGSEYWYANVNYYLLGLVLEKIYEKRLDAILNEELFAPLKMNNTCFKPSKSLWPNIAPTEFDMWRNRVIQGEVHDESACALGGVTGYAGVFSTAKDLFKFALMYLDHGRVGRSQFIDKRLVEQSIKIAFPRVKEAPIFNARHGYSAFRIKARKRIGKYAGKRTYEFSGFTGPTIMIDPDRDLAVVIVENRTYPKRPDSFKRHIQFHAELFETICEGI